MSGQDKIGSLQFHGALDFSWPKIKSLTLENITYQNEWVEGDIVLKYEFNGDQEAKQHFKTKVDEEQSFDIGPLKAKFHVWLEGPKLWLGLTLCLGPLCAPEFKTSVDVPH